MTHISPQEPLAVKAVLLDLDGTLIDTAPDLHAAACAMLREMGRQEVSIEETRHYVGKGMRNLIKRLLSRSLELSEEEAPQEAIDCFRKHYAIENGKQAQCYPGVIEGLDMFREKGLPLAVVTNKPEMFVWPLLERMKLAHYFEVVIGGDTLPRLKPDPMPLLWTCGRLNVLPGKTLFIGDSVNDFLAARAADCKVFMLPYGYNEGKDVRELDADSIVPDLLYAARCVS